MLPQGIFLSPLLLWPSLAIFGLIIGSFLGVVIERLPSGQSVLWGRSACPECGARLQAEELIPLVSYLLQRGRCRHCHAVISPFHPAVEILTMALTLLAAWRAADAPHLIGLLTLTYILIPLAWLDARYFWLPDELTLPGLLAGLAACAVLDQAALPDHLLGCVAGFASLALIRAAYRRWRGREGLGLGDAKLLALAGAWCGWQPLPNIMLGAAVLGIGVALLRRGSGSARLPLGCFMAPAILAAALWAGG
jgi:leader peptidase (prepilin peptidase) / N-methyltransferase